MLRWGIGVTGAEEYLSFSQTVLLIISTVNAPVPSVYATSVTGAEEEVSSQNKLSEGCYGA